MRLGPAGDGRIVGAATRTIGDMESQFADAWEAHNRAEIAAILRADDPARIEAAREEARAALETATAAIEELPDRGLDQADRRAVTAMRNTIGLLASGDSSLSYAVDDSSRASDSRDPLVVLAHDGLAALRQRTAAEYGRAAEAIEIGDGSIVDRLTVLARLATETDPLARRALFLALEPVWRAVDADSGATTSPYRVALGPTAEAWRRSSPVGDRKSVV